MAIKTFTTGEVLTASDTNTYLANAGLVFVKSVNVGASNVSFVDVTDVFSSMYDNYLISYANINASVNGAGFFFRFGTNASPVTTNYSFGGLFSGYTGTTLNLNQNAPGYWEAGGTNTNRSAGQFYVNAPNLSTHSTFTSQFARTDAAFVISGIHQANTQHVSFYMYPSSGTITGGFISVFGVRKA